jgi:cbb3-type cytochrome c oxidase subunit III
MTEARDTIGVLATQFRDRQDHWQTALADGSPETASMADARTAGFAYLDIVETQLLPAIDAADTTAVDAAAAERGKATFAEQCAACHGEDAKGNQEMGAPNLSDAIWLYGSSQDAVTQSIVTGRGGAMPAWSTRLDPVTVKMLALYVHSLGGGK